MPSAAAISSGSASLMESPVPIGTIARFVVSVDRGSGDREIKAAR